MHLVKPNVVSISSRLLRLKVSWDKVPVPLVLSCHISYYPQAGDTLHCKCNCGPGRKYIQPSVRFVRDLWANCFKTEKLQSWLCLCLVFLYFWGKRSYWTAEKFTLLVDVIRFDFFVCRAWRCHAHIFSVLHGLFSSCVTTLIQIRALIWTTLYSHSSPILCWYVTLCCGCVCFLW